MQGWLSKVFVFFKQLPKQLLAQVCLICDFGALARSVREFFAQLGDQFIHAPLFLAGLLVFLALVSGLVWMPWLLLGLFCLGFLGFFWKCSWLSWSLSCLFAGLCLFAIIYKEQARSKANAELENYLQTTQQATTLWQAQVERPLGRSAAAASKRVLAKIHAPDIAPLRVVITSQSALPAGAKLTLRGSMKRFDAPRNPGGFDEGRWLMAQGIDWQMPYPEMIAWEERRYSPQALIAYLRQWCVGRLTQGLEQNSGQEILPALVLGLSGEMSYELKEEFRAAGALHLFAVSGLHVGLIAGLLALLLRGLPGRIRWVLLLSLLAAFVVLSGMRPSALRAWVMVALVIFGIGRGRPQVALNSLGLAALLELCWRPAHIADLGFQFSYLVVLSLLLMALPLQARILQHRWFCLDSFLPQRLEGFRARIWRLSKRYMLTLVLVSAISWLAALPIALQQFGLFNPLAIPLNALLVVLATLALCLGLLGLLLSFVFPLLGFPLRLLAGQIAALMAGIAQYSAQIQPPQWVDRDPLPQKAYARLSLLDLPSGFALFVELGDYRFFYDCGHARDAEYHLKPFLRYRGIDSIDALFLSHADAAHVGAVPSLLDDFAVGEVFVASNEGASLRWQEALHSIQGRGVPLSSIQRGQIAQFAPGVSLEVLHPSGNHHGSRADEGVLVMHLRLGEVSWLIASDLGWLLESVLAKEMALNQELSQGFQGVILDYHPRSPGGYPPFWEELTPIQGQLKKQEQGEGQSSFFILHTAGGTTAQDQLSHFPDWAQSLSTYENGAMIIDLDKEGKVLQVRGWAKQGEF